MYTLREIKDHVNLPALADALGLENWRGRYWCPFHDNTTRPNLSVRSRFYHCFACGAHGDAIDLVVALRSCDFMTALEHVCDFAGLPAPQRRTAPRRRMPAVKPVSSSPKLAARIPVPRRTVQILTEFCRPWRLDGTWCEDHVAFRYLRSRGISRDTAARLGVGVLAAPYDVVEDKWRANVPLEELQAAGLFNAKEKLRLWKHRLLLPFHLNGEVYGLFARDMNWTSNDEGPKELCILNPAVPYNCDVLLDEPSQVYVTEGAIDCLSLAELGLPAVGIPGASGFKPEWVELFQSVQEVVLALDNDDAGRKGADRIIELFASAGRQDIKTMTLPDGIKDCNEYLTACVSEADKEVAS